MTEKLVLPNMIYIGAPKAGSSTFFEYLTQHPQIYMCPTKEPFFFDFNYHRGLDWYSNLFSGYKGERVVGEATVWYLRWDGVPERIAESLDKERMKFIVILRNPMDRAWSNYCHDLQSGHLTPDQTFGYVIRNEDVDRRLARSIASGGLYFRHLQRWLRCFRRDQFLIMLHDDMRTNAQGMARRAYEFLDVDPDFRASIASDRMVTPELRNRAILQGACRIFAPLRGLWNTKRHLRQVFYSATAPREKMAEIDRAFLREYYREDLAHLAELLGVDLSHWK